MAFTRFVNPLVAVIVTFPTAAQTSRHSESIPGWFGRTGPEPALIKTLSSIGLGTRDSLMPYLNGESIPAKDEALFAYLQAFKDLKEGHIEQKAKKLYLKRDGNLTPYQVVYLCVSFLISCEHRERFKELQISCVPIQNIDCSKTVQTPLGYLLLGSFQSMFSIKSVRPVLAAACRKFPNEKGVWDAYAHACETGIAQSAKKIDYNSMFDLPGAIRAREEIIAKWPGDDKDYIALAQDLFYSGQKAKAIDLLQRLLARHKAKDEVSTIAGGLLQYYLKNQ